jgi:LPS-assembly lipoprotein
MTMRALFLGLAVCLAGCGFQLRGAATFPFETIAIPGAGGGIALDLRRTIQAGSNAKVVDQAKDAQAILQFTEETRLREILSLDAAGRTREYRLIYRVGFRVVDGKGGEFLPVNTILIQRDFTFADSLVLSKELEGELIYREMQADMVRQVMRRLEGAQRPKPPGS